MYTRLVIGELSSEEQEKAFLDYWRHEMVPQLAAGLGLGQASLDIEEGGRMVVMTTVWGTREAALRYHASRDYRQFVADTQHMLIGDYVIKFFKRDAATLWIAI